MTLRATLGKCVPSDSLANGSCLNAVIGNIVLISREWSSVYTSGTFASPVLAPLRPNNQPLDRCSTPRLSCKVVEAHSDHPREQSFMSSTVWLDPGRCFVSLFIDHAIPGAICSRVFTPQVRPLVPSQQQFLEDWTASLLSTTLSIISTGIPFSVTWVWELK
jgi:hypothetical protein